MHDRATTRLRQCSIILARLVVVVVSGLSLRETGVLDRVRIPDR
jgi:hypothetical protein